MGEKNDAMCSYLAVPEIFADFINGTLFDGRSQIEEEDVLSYDGVYHEKVKDGKGEKLKLERTRDVIKRIAKGNRYAVVGVKNQYKVHYAKIFLYQKKIQYPNLGKNFIFQRKKLKSTQKDTGSKRIFSGG